MKKIDWQNIFDGEHSDKGHVYYDEKVSKADREFGQAIINEFKGFNYHENPELEAEIRTQAKNITILKVFSCVDRHIVAIDGSDRDKFCDSSFVMFIRKGRVLLKVGEIGAHCDLGTEQWSYRNSDGSCAFNLQDLKGLEDVLERAEEVYREGCKDHYH